MEGVHNAFYLKISRRWQQLQSWEFGIMSSSTSIRQLYIHLNFDHFGAQCVLPLQGCRSAQSAKFPGRRARSLRWPIRYICNVRWDTFVNEECIVFCSNKALGVCNTSSRLGGVICPFVLTLVSDQSVNRVIGAMIWWYYISLWMQAVLEFIVM